MKRVRGFTLNVFSAGTMALFAGCSHSPQHAPVAAAPVVAPAVAAAAPAPAPLAPPAPVAASAASESKASAPAAADQPEFKSPESILWDSDQDVYFVSNVNGDPSAADENGFISSVGPDGKVLDLKWVDGSKKSTLLSAPKGMTIIGDILYVADLTVIRKFDRKTGKAKGKISVAKSVFLNDLAASPDGKTLYASDSGVKSDPSGFASTGDDAVYAIDVKKGLVKPLIKDKGLHSPNGLLADREGVWVVTLKANELFHVSTKGEKGPITTLPKGGLDGIVRLGDGSLLISSWEGAAIFRGLPGSEFKELIANVPSPADIGFDSKRNNVLIPMMMASAIQIRPLPALTPLAPPSAAEPAAAPGPAPAPAAAR